MKYYIIAGEASGDLHGANLMKEIYKLDTNAQIRFWGGDLMQNVGGKLVKHYKDLAFMGFVEVILNLKTILKNIEFCKKDILEFAPDKLIFIDYPGFNMRIAQWSKKQKIENHYYIAPQIWAWKENRIKAIKRDFDYLYVILPFEKPFFEEKHHFKVYYVGHPLIDAISNSEIKDKTQFLEENNIPDKPIIALLPGSRKQEINKMLQIMLSISKDFKDYQFVIAGAPSIDQKFYEKFINQENVSIVYNKTYHLLQNSTAALVTSGTATLETALFKVPEVVCYKGNWISYQIAKRIITLKFISLVNLIMDKEVVKELIQNHLNTENLKHELSAILQSKNRELMLNEYENLEKQLGGKGASMRVAQLLIRL
ncbi:MAG: lipid-A-disaccharide synthase [Flavobacterium sp.]